MNNINITESKRNYFSPTIMEIQLDNEISLILQSDQSPDGDPTFSRNNDYFNNEPFKTNIG